MKFISAAANAANTVKEMAFGKPVDNLKAEIADLKSQLEGSQDEKERATLEAKIAEKEKELAQLEKGKGGQADPSEGMESYIDSLKENGIPYSIVSRNGMIGIRTGKSFSEALQDGLKAGKEVFDKSGLTKGFEKFYDSLIPAQQQEAQKETIAPQMQQALKEVNNSGAMQSLKGGIVDREWYDDERVMMGAVNNVKNPQNVSVCGTVPIGGQLDSRMTGQLLDNEINSAKRDTAQGKTSLMAFQLDDNHWVGGAMAQEGQKQIFFHNDPFGNPMNENLRSAMERNGVEVIDLCEEQQKDSYNCGPYVADNLGKMANKIAERKGQGLSAEDWKQEISSDLSRGNGDELRKKQSAAMDPEARNQSFVSMIEARFARNENSQVQQP